MDFGTKLAFDGHAIPPQDATLPVAWFERSSAEHGSAPERGALDGYAFLDRLRETGGLVYSGDEEA